MFYIYLLWSQFVKEFYTGCTKDLRQRLNKHNQNQVEATRGKGPWQLVYYEACKNKYDAFRREKYLKTGPGKRFIKKRLKYFLEQLR